MNTPLLTEEDGRRIVRLLGEAAARTGETLNQQRRFLMEGLAGLVGADFWLWGHYASIHPGKQPTFVIQIQDGFTGQQFSDLMVASEHPDMAAEMAPLSLELSERNCRLTRRTSDILDLKKYEGSEVVAQWNKAGLGHSLMSLTPLAETCTEFIGLYRGVGEEDFSGREARIAHILYTEVDWLHVPHGEEAAGVAALSPREHSILNLMVSGKSRREVAQSLGLSWQTVVDYQKTIYAHFGVHSQPELMAHFLQGNGGDR